MATLAKPITTTKSKTDWPRLADLAVKKIAENVYDMLMTLVSCALLLWYLLITQHDLAIQTGGYIIAGYVLLALQRVVQDFDKSWTHDEIGDEITALEKQAATIAENLNKANEMLESVNNLVTLLSHKELEIDDTTIEQRINHGS